MSKGEQTKQRIIERSAPVFNTLGYNGTSLVDLIRATGLEKGGIYNHFPSKEALALAAFDYAVEQNAQQFTIALADKHQAGERLLAIVNGFAEQAERPWLPGGCPLANTAIEADDSASPLLSHAQAAMTSWHKLIGSTVKHGVVRGELRQHTDPYMVATIIISALEGALMLSQLYGEQTYMQRVVTHLTSYIQSLKQETAL